MSPKSLESISPRALHLNLGQFQSMTSADTLTTSTSESMSTLRNCGRSPLLSRIFILKEKTGAASAQTMLQSSTTDQMETRRSRSTVEVDPKRRLQVFFLRKSVWEHFFRNEQCDDSRAQNKRANHLVHWLHRHFHC